MTLWEIAFELLPLGCAAAALGLFLETRARQREIELRWGKRQQSAQAELGRLRGQLQDLKTRVEEAERRAEMTAGGALPPAFNLSRRTQALRLFRRGEAPEQIAAALRAPRQEIDLLLKVHRITSKQAEENVHDPMADSAV